MQNRRDEEQPGRMRLADRYELGELIGTGRSAQVFRGRDALLERTVAIKVIRRTAGGDGGGIPVDREVRLAASLRHPGLAALFDAGTARLDGDVCDYLVLELVEGPNLADVLRGRTLTAGEALEVGVQLADALSYVHSQDIVHGDVKPANVLVGSSAETGKQVVKLADFGAARRLGSDSVPPAGLIVGTADYLSPEQVTGRAIGPATDVYSLGLTLIESVTGRPVFAGHGVEAVRTRLRRTQLVPRRLGPGWRELLERMTACDPARRPSAADVRAELITLAGSVHALDPVLTPIADLLVDSTDVVPVSSAGRHRVPHRSRWMSPSPLAAVVLAIAATGRRRGVGRAAVREGQMS